LPHSSRGRAAPQLTHRRGRKGLSRRVVPSAMEPIRPRVVAPAEGSFVGTDRYLHLGCYCFGQTGVNTRTVTPSLHYVCPGVGTRPGARADPVTNLRSGYRQLCGPRVGDGGDWENLRRQGTVLLHALQTGVVLRPLRQSGYFRPLGSSCLGKGLKADGPALSLGASD
jgi:hypothetical protein